MEPISPELALIDPELRRAALAMPDAGRFAFATPRVRPIGPVPSSVAGSSPSWSRRAAQVVLLLGLSAGGVLVANVAARNMSSGPVLITNSTFAAEAAPSPQPAVSLDKRSRIEQQLLQRVVQSPDAHLPRALVDPRTGLALNNLQAVCRSGSKGRYLCILRPSVHKPGEGLYVRYGPGGFTWGRYRRG